MNATDAAPAIEHRIGETGSVTIHLADWDADIQAVEGDAVRVRNAEGGPLPGDLHVDQGPDGFTMRQADRSGLTVILGSRPKGIRLAIEVPVKSTVALQTASGDAIIRGVRGPLTARTASGDLMLVDVAGQARVETVSGDASIRLNGLTVLAVKTVSGDVLVEGGRVDRFVFATTSGDLRIMSELGEGPHAIATVSGDALVTSRNGLSVAAQTVTGDLSSDLPHTSGGRSGRRSLVVGNGSTALQFRSVSGDLRVVGHDAAEELLAITPPIPPTPPTAPTPPVPPAPPTAPALPTLSVSPIDSSGEEPNDDARLEILRALERGEIDVEEATSRLATLDEPSHE